MVWDPQASTDPDDRPVGGGQTGYYEVREDGSLGDFLGRQIPAALKGMRPTKR
jgi:hypothetical protein